MGIVAGSPTVSTIVVLVVQDSFFILMEETAKMVS